MAKSFSAAIDDWVREVPERQTAVFRGALQRLVGAAQTPVGAGGSMPVRDGFLRASIRANLTDRIPGQSFKPKGQRAFTYDPSEVTVTIASADATDRVTIAWTANYARYAHWGARGRAGSPFLTLAAQRWSSFVAQAAEEAKADAQSRG